MNDPIAQFQNWFEEAISQSKVAIPAACCLSTRGLDGYPNSRFVSLKGVIDGRFLVAGSMSSRKGQELKRHPKAALTFWWAEVERQVRIQGDVSFVDDAYAEALFEARSKDSRIVSALCAQGEVIDDPALLEKQFETKKKTLGDASPEVPAGWGAILIDPKRIEFMEFRESRLHVRDLYEKEEAWQKCYLAP